MKMSDNHFERNNNRRTGSLRFVSGLIALMMVCAMALTGCGGIIGGNTDPTDQAAESTQPVQTQPAPTETEAPPETEPETEPTEPPLVAETGRATIAVTGDVISHIPVINAGYRDGGYNYDSFFTYIKPYVTEADFAVINLETTLAGTENGDKYSGYPKFNCPDAMVDAMKNAGFDMLLTANNHSNDTGSYGFNRTQEVIADRGLLNLGTMTSAEDPKYRVQDINGIKVGMVCYTYGVIDGSTGQKAVNGLPIRMELTNCINVFDYDRLDRFYSEMESIVAQMNEEGAEALVLFIHWGNEYRLSQNSYQTTIAQKMCDLGVDVIVGGHPHVIEPVELLTSTVDPQQKTVCVYSVGNVISNQRAQNMNLDTGHTEDGMLFSFTFVEYEDGAVFLDGVEILPTWVYIRYGATASYDVLPLDKNVEDWGAALEIGETILRSANRSYDRTIELVGPGMEQIGQYLSESREARAEVYEIPEDTQPETEAAEQ